MELHLIYLLAWKPGYKNHQNHLPTIQKRKTIINKSSDVFHHQNHHIQPKSKNQQTFVSAVEPNRQGWINRVKANVSYDTGATIEDEKQGENKLTGTNHSKSRNLLAVV